MLTKHTKKSKEELVQLVNETELKFQSLLASMSLFKDFTKPVTESDLINQEYSRRQLHHSIEKDANRIKMFGDYVDSIRLILEPTSEHISDHPFDDDVAKRANELMLVVLEKELIYLRDNK